MVHRGLTKLKERLVKPVLVSPDGEGDNLVGNIKMRIVGRQMVCYKTPRDSYNPELGAKSIFNAVDEAVMIPLVTWYLHNGDDFDEGQEEDQFIGRYYE
ncbi:hypothetical protein F5X96DRAFT_621514 [Biscogniauxia mediterranea]|nr:hypothetical protein F5X96DRAFT_621514 [Biscogniauxia mediterranea]